MKLTFNPASIALCAMLAGCGQTGPLYLPAQPAQATAEKPAEPKPAQPVLSPANK